MKVSMITSFIYGLFFRLLHPIIMVITGIIIYVILNGRGKSTLLGLAFIIYGLVDAVAASIFFLAITGVFMPMHGDWSPGSYIVMVNFVSSMISLAALIVFVVLVITGVNKILENEHVARAPYTTST